MANCCQGNECNHIITIGYLKTFIGNEVHSSTDDSVLSVNNSDDTYCPTYSELTDGTLIQNWQSGTTPNGDTDGIIVGGSYAADQCVQQKDLSMKYTRFKSLAISVTSVDKPSTNCTGSYDACIDECGGCATLAFSHLYTRYTKSMDGSCSVSTSSAEASDTESSEISWSETGAGYFSGNKKYCFDQNGTVSSSTRCGNVSTSITFRSATKNSNTLKICQAPLTGSYVYWKGGSSAYTSYDRYSISPWDFDCKGGTWYGTAYYSVHTTTWDVYRWKDSCNNTYDNLTDIRNKVGPTVTSNYSESHGSGTVSSRMCEPEDYSSGNVYESYTDLGTTRSDYWRQNCPGCPGCEDYTAYTYTDQTVDCTAGRVDVPYSWIAYSATATDEGCVYTEKGNGSGSYRVTWDCTTAGGQVDPHVTVTGAPCCSEYCTYRFADIEVPCDEAAATSVTTGYTATCHHADGSTTTEEGTASASIPAVSCNSGNDRIVQSRSETTSLSTAKAQVTQKGRSDCCPCLNPSVTYTIADIELPCSAAAATTKTVSYTAVTTYSNCDPETVTSTTTVSVPAVSCNSGSDNTIQNGNTGATLATAKPKIVQKGGCTCCSCSDLTVSPTSLTWDEYADPTSDSSKKTITITAQPCVTGIATGGTLSHFSASLNGSTITVQPNAWADEYDDIVETLKVTYNGSCTSSITLTHESVGCNCDHLWPHGAYETSIDAQTLTGSMNFYVDCHPAGSCAVEGDGSISFGKYKIIAETSGIKGFRADWCEDDFYIILNAVSNETVDSYRVEFNGSTCYRSYIRRVCPCPCDNCSSTGVYEHPLYLDYAYRDYPSGGRATSPHEGDTIYVPTTSFSYTGTIIRGATTGTSTGATEEHYLKVTGGTVMTGTNHLQVGDVISGACGFIDILVRSSNYIDYYAYKNTGGNREGTVVFGVDAGTIISGSGTWRDGMAACGQVNVIVKQAGNEKKYRVCCKNKWTGYNERVIRNWDDTSLDGNFTNRYCDETPECGIS